MTSIADRTTFEQLQVLVICYGKLTKELAYPENLSS